MPVKTVIVRSNRRDRLVSPRKRSSRVSLPSFFSSLHPFIIRSQLPFQFLLLMFCYPYPNKLTGLPGYTLDFSRPHVSPRRNLSLHLSKGGDTTSNRSFTPFLLISVHAAEEGSWSGSGHNRRKPILRSGAWAILLDCLRSISAFSQFPLTIFCVLSSMYHISLPRPCNYHDSCAHLSLINNQCHHQTGRIYNPFFTMTYSASQASNHPP
jgi:hypothetical protein